MLCIDYGVVGQVGVVEVDVGVGASVIGFILDQGRTLEQRVHEVVVGLAGFRRLGFVFLLVLVLKRCLAPVLREQFAQVLSEGNQVRQVQLHLAAQAGTAHDACDIAGQQAGYPCGQQQQATGDTEQNQGQQQQHRQTADVELGDKGIRGRECQLPTGVRDGIHHTVRFALCLGAAHGNQFHTVFDMALLQGHLPIGRVGQLQPARDKRFVEGPEDHGLVPRLVVSAHQLRHGGVDLAVGAIGFRLARVTCGSAAHQVELNVVA